MRRRGRETEKQKKSADEEGKAELLRAENREEPEEPIAYVLRVGEIAAQQGSDGARDEGLTTEPLSKGNGHKEEAGVESNILFRAVIRGKGLDEGIVPVKETPHKAHSHCNIIVLQKGKAENANGIH